MKRTSIIAEAGVNHNGSIELAKQLVDAAADAGVDFVKFQTFKAENLVNKMARKAAYQIANTQNDDSQLNMLKKLELPYEAHFELMEYCAQKGVRFLSTPFDFDSMAFLNELGIDLFKIPSGEITNLPYLRQINAYRKPVILSTGMATLDEVAAALEILKDCNVSPLHCTTEYPCPYEDVNLRAMLTLKERFGLPVGYSDHTNGIEIPIAAVALGAEIVEKHFTLDRNMEGPDHRASLEPHELKAMVTAIRRVESSLGTGAKVPAESEKKNIAIARKSIVAKRLICRGDVFTKDNLTVKRPGTGISPMQWDAVIGQVAARDYQVDELI